MMVVTMWSLTVVAIILSHSHMSKGDYQPTSGNYTEIIQTTLGKVQGRTVEVLDAKGRTAKVDVFWGIPYAKPPVGDLRFRPPVPPYPFKGVFQAVKQPNSCMQVLPNRPTIYTNPPTPLSEDCLYLNIWRPRCGNQGQYGGGGSSNGGYGNSSGLTTMFWIHGGTFQISSSTVPLFNGAKLAASECVIVVSTNYRIGALGFLSLDVPNNSGNMGAQDVIQALKWVKSNVANFGGNQGSITLFGNGIGGAIETVILLSPLTQNLVKNVILEGGETSGPISHQSKKTALEVGLEFAKKFNCYSNNRSLVLDCLKKVDAAALAEGYAELSQDFKKLMLVVVDGYLLPRSPRDVYMDKASSGAAPGYNILTGNNKDDGTHVMSLMWPDLYDLRQPNPPILTDKELDRRLLMFLDTWFHTRFIKQMAKDVKDIYKLNKLKYQAANPALTFFDSIFTDVIFTCVTRLQAAAYARSYNKAYVFSFDYTATFSQLPKWVGVTHKSDVPFVFGNNVPDVPKFSDRGARLSAEIMRYWANFAKYGNPTPGKSDYPKWPTYTSDPGSQILFTETATVQVGRTKVSPCDYWNNLPRKYIRN